MRSAIGLDHEEKTVDPAFNVSRNVVIRPLTLKEIKDGNTICLEAPLTNRLANVSIESNAQLRKSLPLCIAQESVKAPAVQ